MSGSSIVLTVIVVVVAVGAILAVEAAVFMWLFNVVARYFEWKELSYLISFVVVVLLNLLVGALKND